MIGFKFEMENEWVERKQIEEKSTKCIAFAATTTAGSMPVVVVVMLLLHRLQSTTGFDIGVNKMQFDWKRRRKKKLRATNIFFSSLFFSWNRFSKNIRLLIWRMLHIMHPNEWVCMWAMASSGVAYIYKCASVRVANVRSFTRTHPSVLVWRHGEKKARTTNRTKNNRTLRRTWISSMRALARSRVAMRIVWAIIIINHTVKSSRSAS